MTTTTEPGFYLDPIDPEIYREWDGNAWTSFTRTRLDEEPSQRYAPHIGKASPAPGERVVRVPGEAGPSTGGGNTRSNAPLVISIVWAIAAAIIGAVFIFGTQDIAYGGDAYTGIQNTGAQTVRALGWLIIATGPLGLIIALSRR